MVRSIIGSLLGVASEEVAVLIADNSENDEKRQFLKEMGRINPNVIVVSHQRNIGALGNFFYLYEWAKHVPYVAQMADDDWVSPEYHLDAYRTLVVNPRACGAETGTTWVDFGDGKPVYVSQPSMCGNAAIDRMAQWNGLVARVTMYNVSRRSALEAAIRFQQATPLNGTTLVEDLWELNRLALGDFLHTTGHGCLVHYPAMGSRTGDGAQRVYDGLYREAGLQYPFVWFGSLSTAIQCAMFLTGKLSPIADLEQRTVCGQFVFRQIFTNGFLTSISSEPRNNEAAKLFTHHPEAMGGLLKYCNAPFSEHPVLDRPLIDWFIEVIKVLETKPSGSSALLSERFRRFVDGMSCDFSSGEIESVRSIGHRRGESRTDEPSPIFVTTSDGVSISVPASLACISTYVLLEQEQWFEKEVGFLLRWLKPGMNAIDVGANVGVYTLPIARAIGDAGRVFAFEPGGETRRHLEASRIRNKLSNLQISGCALSDLESEGWLHEGDSSEYNFLGTGLPPSGAERVRVSTLDIQESECRWPSIDFVKIDAEGQEERIVAGGRRFFSSHSPLVMYEIQDRSGQNSSARWVLAALGYRMYRMLGDASCLVPLGNDEQFDSYELNIFAAKPDRAAALASQGLLVETSVEHSLTEDERKIALEGLLTQPYARAFEFSVEDIASCPFGEALAAYAAYRHCRLPPARRYAALNKAFGILGDYCAENKTPGSLATLSRVALDMGKRHFAVESLNKLIAITATELDQPFFPPCERYEGLSPTDRESDWFVAASNEQFELSRSHSSCFVDSELDRLKWLSVGPFSSAAINRRLILEAARQGSSLSDLVGYVRSEHQHRNPAYWTAKGLPDLLGLL